MTSDATRHQSPAGIVLCGGQSRRMGRPKAWLPFGPDEVLLQRVTRLVSQACDPVVVVAAPGQELPELREGIRVVRDPVSDRGPLQGLAAGLAALADDVELAFATATDVPFLSPRWVECLRSHIGENDVAIPFIDGYHHPLAALYRRATVLPTVETLLARDRLRPFFLVEALRSVILGPEAFREADPELKSLRNLNTPADYERALADR